MRRVLLTTVFGTLMFLSFATALSAKGRKMASPDGKLTLVAKDGGFILSYGNQQMLDMPVVGMGSVIPSRMPAFQFAGRAISDYKMLAGKRKVCKNTANEYQVQLSKQIKLILRLYDDGLAFRYELTGLNGVLPPQEQTVFRIPEGTRRWMQQWAESYEGFFPLSETAKVKPVPSFGPQSVTADGWNSRWGYPALLEPHDGLFALITESDIERQQSASCLYNDKETELFRVCPDKNETKLNGSWHTPWRVVIVGSLADIVASTLVTDVAEPCRLSDVSWISPGVVSWVYWAYNHGSSDFDIIRKYVDMAVKLRLPYVLIDAEWDEMKNGKTVEDAIAYARECGVKPMIWYNSSVGWIDGAPGPKFRLNKPEDREREFAWCERLGVAGVKIDFFSGDNQMNMDYCIDLLESAARHHLLVNFHGATIPRGWQRTYPNLLSTEGVYGAEWYNNVPTFTKKAAAHNATLPFTRNVIGPMDYTPCAFSDSQHPHITSHAHELALTVVFESGLQHLADRPESFLAQPDEVQQFLGSLPVAWDETRLLAGYPGDHVVMARRAGDVWYVAGINGRDESRDLPLALKGIVKSDSRILLFADDSQQERAWQISRPSADRLPSAVPCRARGGFVLVINNNK